MDEGGLSMWMKVFPSCESKSARTLHVCEKMSVLWKDEEL